MVRRARRRLEYLQAALGDLKRLHQDDPALALEAGRILTDVAAGRCDGEPLSAMAATGDLTDCRKIYFGHRNEPTHRIVLQVRPDGTIEVVLVVAVESRADAYVYLLSAEHLQRLPAVQQPNLDRLRQGRIAERGRRRSQ